MLLMPSDIYVYNSSIWQNQRLWGKLRTESISNQRMAREITEEMLDAIEAVKGSRSPGLWDPRCEQYMNKQKKPKKASDKTPVKE